jgi:hypothetical protein
VSERFLLKKRLDIAALAIFLIGTCASAAIYLFAAPTEQNTLVNEFQNSKVYRHSLEAYGGKLSIVSDDLAGWFSSLWQGKTLAFTIASLSIAVALLLFWAARRIPAGTHERTDISDEGTKGSRDAA